MNSTSSRRTNQGSPGTGVLLPLPALLSAMRCLFARLSKASTKQVFPQEGYGLERREARNVWRARQPVATGRWPAEVFPHVPLGSGIWVRCIARLPEVCRSISPVPPRDCARGGWVCGPVQGAASRAQSSLRPLEGRSKWGLKREQVHLEADRRANDKG
jgi:hypothetical protein